VSFNAVLRDTRLVAQDERNLNNAGDASSHQRVTKHLMGHGANHQLLRVRGHGPTGHEEDKAWDEVALGSAIAVPTKPDASQTRAPPDDAHGGVLPVVLDPSSAPAVLGKGVDAAPGGNNDAVKELLTPSRPAQPDLSNKQENGQDHTVPNESAAHDEVGQALAQVVALAEAQSRDATKDHLCPGDDRECLAVDAMQDAHGGSDAAVNALLEVKLEVDAQDDLGNHVEEDKVGKLCVYVVCDELPALVKVTESVAEKGEEGAQHLERYVPSTLDNLDQQKNG